MERIYYTKSEIIEKLRLQLGSHVNQAYRGLLTIYSFQTSDEQLDGYTEENNGVGFTGIDSEFLSSLAENLKKYGKLSEKQTNCLFKLMPKYANQLFNISMSKNLIKYDENAKGRAKYYW